MIIKYLHNLGVELSKIKGFSDSCLKYHIDDREKYFQYINQKIIKEMPGGIKADKGILAYCLKHDNALLVSQDLMREFYRYLPYKRWILEKRISIILVDDELYLIPMFDGNFDHEIRKVKKNDKIKQKKLEDCSKNTLDVLQIIEDSDKDSVFDLYD